MWCLVRNKAFAFGAYRSGVLGWGCHDWDKFGLRSIHVVLVVFEPLIASTLGQGFLQDKKGAKLNNCK